MSQLSEAVEEWRRDPITKWFFKHLKERFSSVYDDWKSVTTLEDLAKLRGKAEVLDHIKTMLDTPDDYLPVR